MSEYVSMTNTIHTRDIGINTIPIILRISACVSSNS